MKLTGKVAVITGAGSGIGAALAARFVTEGARAVVVADLDAERAEDVAARIGQRAVAVDVTDSDAVAELVASTAAEHGRLDVFCSNAGIATGTSVEDPLQDWRRVLDVNLMAHVFAARAAVPVMRAQGGGYLVQTCSAAGLLTAPGDAAYSVSKHAAVALAEALAVQYAADGILVSALCPLGVDTPLLAEPLAAGHVSAGIVAASGQIISPAAVAQAVVEAMQEETFLILPHPEVARYYAGKAADPDRWLATMGRVLRG